MMKNRNVGMPTTELSVFIIESLPENDPALSRRDGEILVKQLALTLQKPKYVFAKNKVEFQNALNDFKKSKCRFLHISCHGEKGGNVVRLGTDPVNFREFAQMFPGRLQNNRITFSTCFVGQGKLFREIFKVNNTAVHSILGFCKGVDVELASAFWIAYYTLVTRLTYAGRRSQQNDTDRIHVSGLAKIVERLSALFHVDIKLNYVSKDPKSNSWLLVDGTCVPKNTQWRSQNRWLLEEL